MALKLDMGAVSRGAIGSIVVFGPVAIVLRALANGNKNSSAWIPLVFVFFLAFMFAGWLAAYDRPPTPLTHGAAAGAVGFGVVFVIVLVLRAITGTESIGTVIAGLVFLEVAAGLGLLGGLLASKGVRVK